MDNLVKIQNFNSANHKWMVGIVEGGLPVE